MLDTNKRYDRPPPGRKYSKKGIIKGDNNEERINKWINNFLNLLGGSNIDETGTF